METCMNAWTPLCVCVCATKVCFLNKKQSQGCWVLHKGVSEWLCLIRSRCGGKIIHPGWVALHWEGDRAGKSSVWQTAEKHTHKYTLGRWTLISRYSVDRRHNIFTASIHKTVVCYSSLDLGVFFSLVKTECFLPCFSKGIQANVFPGIVEQFQ